MKKLLVIIVTGFLLTGNPAYAADVSTNTTSTTLSSTSTSTENLTDCHTISKINLNEAKTGYYIIKSIVMVIYGIAAIFVVSEVKKLRGVNH